MLLEQQDIQKLELVYRQVFFFPKFRSILNDNIKIDFKGKWGERVKGSSWLSGRLLPTQ